MKATQSKVDWSKVDRSGDCWLWTAAIGSHGRGVMRWNGKPTLAYRIAWELTSGPILDGLHVCHDCDNPPCVNPSHLFLGTHLDNMRDMVAKGMHPRAVATRCPNAHEYTPDNIWWDKRGRHCRICRAAQGRRARARIKAIPNR